MIYFTKKLLKGNHVFIYIKYVSKMPMSIKVIKAHLDISRCNITITESLVNIAIQ